MASTINGTSTGNGGLISTGDDSGILNIQTNETTAITVDASQRVAFVAGTAALPAITTAGDTNTGIFFPAADTVAVSTGGSGRMFVNSSGYVGIGKSSPESGLDIRAGITGNFNAITMGYGRSANPTDAVHKISWSSDSLNIEADTANSIASNIIFTNDNTERMRINSSGYLQCAGVYNQTNPNAANVFVGTAGDLYRSTSSLKYKKNIENSVHGLTDLLKLRSVTYQSNNPDNGEQVFGGFIAEEVHDAGLNEFVQYAENGSPDALAYGNMVALCVKSIQELKAINDTQAETINALTARIVALETA
jgi:hypothetical protein